MNGNDLAENRAPVDGNMNGGHRADDGTANNQNLTLLSTTMALEHTDDPTVRRLHDPSNAVAPPCSEVPLTLASPTACRMTARDRRELGLEPSLVLESGEASNGQPNPTSDNFNTTDGVYASVDSETGCNHEQAQYSDGGVVGNGYNRAQASPNTPTDDAPLINVSDLRVEPVSRKILDELAIFSQYSEDKPNRVALDEGTAASSQMNSTTPARRCGHITLLGNENTNYGDEQALVSPNSPTRPQAADAIPPSDLASHRLRGRTSSIDPDHGSTSDSYTCNSTPRD